MPVWMVVSSTVQMSMQKIVDLDGTMSLAGWVWDAYAIFRGTHSLIGYIQVLEGD